MESNILYYMRKMVPSLLKGVSSDDVRTRMDHKKRGDEFITLKENSISSYRVIY